MLDEYNMVVGEKNGALCIFDINGNLVKQITDNPDDTFYYNPDVYNNKYVIYNKVSKTDYKTVAVYAYDIVNDEIITVCEGDNSYIYLYLYNDKFYCYEPIENETPYYSNKVFEYDLVNRSFNELYTGEYKPGHTNSYSAGLSGFKVINDAVYYVLDDETSSFYNRITKTNGAYASEYFTETYRYDYGSLCTVEY